MRVISKEFASRTRRCRSARRPPPARVHPCFPAEIKSAKATSSVRSCGTVIPKSKARPLGPPRRHPPRHLELSLDPTRPKKGTRWRRTGTRGPAPGRRAARPGLGRPQDSGRNRGQEGKRGVGVGGESRRTRADKSAPKFPRLHRPRPKRPPVRPGPPPRVRPTPPPAARPGPALTCGGLGGGARGRRGAQPQPEVQRRPEHARAQQHQPVSHWPPPPAPPRAPVARRALPRPGGGQGTCRGGGRRPCDGSRRSRRRPGASRFPAASLGTSDAGGGGPWAAGAPPLAGPPHAPHPAPPPSLSLAPAPLLVSRLAPRQPAGSWSPAPGPGGRRTSGPEVQKLHFPETHALACVTRRARRRRRRSYTEHAHSPLLYHLASLQGFGGGDAEELPPRRLGSPHPLAAEVAPPWRRPKELEEPAVFSRADAACRTKPGSCGPPTRPDTASLR